MPLPNDSATGLTHAELLSIITYDEAAQAFRWLKNGFGPYHRAGEIAGSRDDRPYPVLTIHGRTYYKHRLFWFYTHGVWPADELDHKDGNRQDLTKLRPATRQQNARNQGPMKDNKSGFRGVSLTRGGKYAAFYGVNGKSIYIGTFETAELAARAYDATVAPIYGDFARLNFPSTTGVPK